MSALAGLVAFTGDRAADRLAAEAEPMIAAVSARSRGGTDRWSDDRAVLSMRRTRSDSPPAFARRDGVATLVYDGEVDNAADLQSRCDVRADGDAEVLLSAYLEWGAAFAERLHGRYAIAVHDHRTQELLLVRDRLGVRPLCYRAGATEAAFASTPGALLAGVPGDPHVDLDGLRELLGFVRTPGATLFRGVHEVPPGSVVRIDATGVHRHTYWSLPAHEHTDDYDKTVARVRELLDRAVRRTLSGPGAVDALLSGMDSSVIVALAQQARGDQPLHSYAVDFTIPGLGPPTPRGTSPLARLAARLGTVHTDLVENALRLTSPATRTAALAARDAPPLGEFDTSLYLILQAVGRRSGTVLSGDGADELFGGYHWSHDPVTAYADGFAWVGLLRGFDRFAALLRPDLATALDLPAFRADRYAEAVAEAPVPPGEPEGQRRMRIGTYLHMTRFLPIVLERTDRMGAAAGVMIRTPFTDHELAEYAYNIPWSMQGHGGRKGLLHAATADLRPADLAPSAGDHAPEPHTANLPYHRALCETVRAVLDRPDAPVAQMLHAPAVTALLDADPNAGQLDRMETELELIIGIDAWLAGHRLAAGV